MVDESIKDESIAIDNDLSPEEWEKDAVELHEASEEMEAEAELSDEAIISALEGCSSFYDLLAALYFRPLKIEQIDNIANMDLSLYADVNEYFADGINDITRYLRKRNTGTRQELAVDFTTAFAGTSSWKGRYAVPYESVFTSQEGLMFQEAYHEVYQLYRKNRVKRSEGYDYPDDHLSFMCEFEVILADRIIEAIGEGDYATAYEQAVLARDFLNDHILSWFDDFQDLSLKLIKTRFYRGVLKISKGFFLFDGEVLDEAIVALADRAGIDLEEAEEVEAEAEVEVDAMADADVEAEIDIDIETESAPENPQEA